MQIYYTVFRPMPSRNRTYPQPVQWEACANGQCELNSEFLDMQCAWISKGFKVEIYPHAD